MNKQFQDILIATSDPLILKDMMINFSNSGFNVVSAADGIEALYLAERSGAELIILDSDIMKISAPELVALFKKIPGLSGIYIILLHPPDYVFAVNGSIDEYLEKPISAKLLVSKVKSIDKSILRKPAAPMSRKMVIGDFAVNRDTYMVYFKGEEILLPRKEFELIFLLASRPEKVFTREEIFRHIWHKDITPKEGRTIDVHIRKLRSKISEDLISTVKGIGYKIVI